MAHLANPDRSYRLLQQRLDRNVTGAPDGPAFTQILKLLFAPVLPSSSQQVHSLLGHDGDLFGRQYTEMVADARGQHLVLRYDHRGATGSWQPAPLPAGQPLRKPEALFIKLDESVIEEELARMQVSTP